MIELVVPVLMDEPPPAGLQPAARRAFTKPIRVALIDNGKPKARELLEAICKALNTHIPVASSRLIAKGSASRVIDDEEVEAISAQADVVITGLGDCGACSACSLGDAVKMEAAGIPATVVITDVFTRHIASFATTLGMPGYHAAVVPHPIYAKDAETLSQIAQELAAVVATQLQGEAVPPQRDR
ncbi:hypothetical protein NOR51B_1947 [Luminiphilus syltensis NOR5-1B]|uniref:UGSC-like domain-containing protein n=2 Tax=Luminiphilus TaxID=1341118 RepID=B8KXF0_9GAMM|nr:hypothetical protein NOR51B_1947 [Luminiphilus syltensis NOR5-1B]